MKIIEIIYSLSSGGAERFVVDLSNEFVAKGNDVLLCTLLDDKKNNRAFYKFELNQKIEYVNLGYEKLGISCILSIYKLINKYKPDVVHMHLSNVPILCLFAILFLRTSEYVVTCHNQCESELNYSKLPFIKKWLFRLGLYKMIAISDANAESIHRCYGEMPNALIYNGRKSVSVSTELSKVKNEIRSFCRSDNTVVFLNIARYAPQKNHKRLIRCFNKFIESGYDAILLIIGSDFNSKSGLWGLRCGNKITVIPQYREVFDLCADRAAVRFEDGRTGVVDDSGTPLMVTDRCRRLRFLKGELLSVTKEDGSDCYTDLKTNRTYQERPVVFSYGGIELLRVGETFHSRTRKAYASMHGLHKDSLCFYGFYLKIPDYRVPKSCRLVNPVWSTIFDVFACVLEGDDEEVYWCCGCLADRSIVVMDGEGNYYHVEKGKGKRYIACNAPKAGEADFASVVEGLRKEAGRRAESVQRERQQNEEEKRRKRLEEIKDVLPFRMGMKWG